MLEEDRTLRITSASKSTAKRQNLSYGFTMPKLWAGNYVGREFTVMISGDVVMLVPKEKADEYREKFENMMEGQ